MAFPVILIDSTDGAASDSLCSGAGPATALTGTGASTSADGLTVTLDAGTDLTNVLTDGSHVIYLADATAGNRNFGRITGKAGSGGATPTVTVDVAFGASLSGLSWAIGGVRASLGSTSSYKLIDNNSTFGDVAGGWTIRLLSGHTETRANRFLLRSTSNFTDGPCTLEGEDGAATKPQLTSSAGDTCIQTEGGFSGPWRILRLKAEHTQAGQNGIRLLAGRGSEICDCDVTLASTTGTCFYIKKDDKIERCTSVNGANGLQIVPSANSSCHAIGNRFKNASSHGIAVSGGDGSFTIRRNIIDNAGGDGINIAALGTNSGGLIEHNTVYSAGGDGIDVANDVESQTNLSICSNIVKDSGGYAINLNSATLAELLARNLRIRGNNYHGNTSGTVSVSGVDEESTTTDPNFVNAAGGDFTPQAAALEGTAYPTSIP